MFRRGWKIVRSIHTKRIKCRRRDRRCSWCIRYIRKIKYMFRPKIISWLIKRRTKWHIMGPRRILLRHDRRKQSKLIARQIDRTLGWSRLRRLQLTQKPRKRKWLRCMRRRGMIWLISRMTSRCRSNGDSSKGLVNRWSKVLSMLRMLRKRGCSLGACKWWRRRKRWSKALNRSKRFKRGITLTRTKWLRRRNTLSRNKWLRLVGAARRRERYSKIVRGGSNGMS